MDGKPAVGGEVLARFASLNQYQRDGVKAPHKPLLALLAVARLMKTGSSELPFSVAEAALGSLIAQYAPSSQSNRAQSVAYPFTRLRSDGVWVLDSDVPMDLVGPLREGNVTGRLEPGVEGALRADAERARRLARDLVTHNFPASACPDVLHAVGLDPNDVLAPDRRRSRVAIELADYLYVSLDRARDQFRDLQRRKPVTSGRQVDFLPVETLLCLAAAYVVNHRSFGGSTAGKAPSPVPELARLFARRPSSVLAKMANLDGSRSHGARWDARVGAILREEQLRFAHVYRTLFAAARAEGIASDRLPDFLHLENGGELTLLGQDELGPAELDRLLTEADPDAEVPDPETERIVVAQARVNQHLFARNVLRNCGCRCVFCGLSPSLFGGRRMLVAGHIKPWRDSTPKERLDVRNGLAACPAHDVAFDNGLLTVEIDLRIHVAPDLAVAIESDDTARHFYGSPPLSQALILPMAAQSPGSKYLGWHRDRIFGFRH
jgi:putative restriction endonuclease